MPCRRWKSERGEVARYAHRRVPAGMVEQAGLEMSEDGKNVFGMRGSVPPNLRLKPTPLSRFLLRSVRFLKRFGLRLASLRQSRGG